jgi:hypothetical protein
MTHQKRLNFRLLSLSSAATVALAMSTVTTPAGAQQVAPASVAPAAAPAPVAPAAAAAPVAPAPAPEPAAPPAATTPELAPLPPPPPLTPEPVAPPLVAAPGDAKVAEAPLDDLVAVKGKWSPVLYGFVEFDSIRDSTQSFNDLAGNGNIARNGTYAAEHARTTFGVRNSRLGFKLTAPTIGEVKTSGVLEMDFLGNQPSPITEAGFFNNPTFRIRHFAMKIEDPYVDVLIGQYWQLFGWQSSFHPNTVEIQGVPGQVYSRAAQVRLSHRFKTDAVDFEIAAAAARPPQRDAATPDGQAGLRLFVNKWKGMRTAGGTGSAVDSLSVGVSGVLRHFGVPPFTGSGTGKEIQKNGTGISVDALVPVIPATTESKANAITLTGSYVTGTGISDLYTGLTGGVAFPSLPNPTNASPAPTYTSDLDAGLAQFDGNGNLHTIDWQSYIVGIQYYLPPSGKLWVSANYSHMKSDNAKDYTPTSSQSKVFVKSEWADVNLFWDAVPAVRLGAEYAFFKQTYADGKEGKNGRLQFSAFYLF